MISAASTASGNPVGDPLAPSSVSVAHEGHAHLGGQVDERLTADVDHRPADRAPGEGPRSLARVVRGHRLAGVLADVQPLPGDGELTGLGPDPALPDRLSPACRVRVPSAGMVSPSRSKEADKTVRPAGSGSVDS